MRNEPQHLYFPFWAIFLRSANYVCPSEVHTVGSASSALPCCGCTQVVLPNPSMVEQAWSRSDTHADQQTHGPGSQCLAGCWSAAGHCAAPHQVFQLPGQLDAAGGQPTGLQHDHVHLSDAAAHELHRLRRPGHAGQTATIHESCLMSSLALHWAMQPSIASCISFCAALYGCSVRSRC